MKHIHDGKEYVTVARAQEMLDNLPSRELLVDKIKSGEWQAIKHNRRWYILKEDVTMPVFPVAQWQELLLDALRSAGVVDDGYTPEHYYDAKRMIVEKTELENGSIAKGTKADRAAVCWGGGPEVPALVVVEYKGIFAAAPLVTTTTVPTVMLGNIAEIEREIIAAIDEQLSLQEVSQ